MEIGQGPIIGHNPTDHQLGTQTGTGSSSGTKGSFSFSTYTKEIDRISSGDFFEPRAVSLKGSTIQFSYKPHSLISLEISF